MKLDSFIGYYETAHFQMAQGVYSHPQWLNEKHKIDEQMKEAGFDINDISDASYEGEMRSIRYLKSKLSK
jgi:hypothetical protein